PHTTVSVPDHSLSVMTLRTKIYTLSLHDALPIYKRENLIRKFVEIDGSKGGDWDGSIRWKNCYYHRCRTRYGSISCKSVYSRRGDRKSTRLNSSHVSISYAVFCLKKKKTHSTHEA